MLLYYFPALLTPFPRTFFIKDNANNGRNPYSCPFPAIAFINEEATGCINEEAIGTINQAAIGPIVAPRKLLSCFFLFHILLFQSHHQLIDLVFLVTQRF